MKNLLRSIALLMLCVILLEPAFAQTTTTTVTVPWGDFVASLLTGAQQIIVLLMIAAATAVIAMLPSWVQDIVRPVVLTWRTNQLFEKGAATIIAGTKGAVAGKTAEIPIANEMVRGLVQLALDRGSPMLLEFIGKNAQSLAEKALARLQEKGVIPPEYTIDQAVDAAATVTP